MSPELVSSKGGDWVRGVTDEAACCVGVEAKHKGDEEMMGVPESFERLLTDLCVSRSVHQEHT